jgi:hypothetical protein
MGFIGFPGAPSRSPRPQRLDGIDPLARIAGNHIAASATVRQVHQSFFFSSVPQSRSG